MCDSASESDTSSVDGLPPFRSSVATREQLQKRVDSLQQENLVLKTEVETLKLKIKALQQENQQLRRNSVNIQAKAEQEEEYISNTLLKKITELKKEKESLALNYEQEEEFLTNDLSRKLNQLRQEKVNLEQTLEKEQEQQVTKLMRRIEKLETDVVSKQNSLDRLRREKVELENALEQEQEALVNRLWKKMEKLESEKKILQERLEITSPEASPGHSRDRTGSNSYPDDNVPVKMETDVAPVPLVIPRSSGAPGQTQAMSAYVRQLRAEVHELRRQLVKTQTERDTKWTHMEREERQLVEENLRLKKRLQMEMERRQEMRRHLSESESSLEMDDERHFNESRSRNISSPQPPCNQIRPPSPTMLSVSTGRSCRECGQPIPSLITGGAPAMSSPSSLVMGRSASLSGPTSLVQPSINVTTANQTTNFVKPSPPAPSTSLPTGQK